VFLIEVDETLFGKLEHWVIVLLIVSNRIPQIPSTCTIRKKMLEVKEILIYRSFSSEEEYLTNVVVVQVENRKTNEIMKVLCEQFPLLAFDLAHLRRVRKSVANPEAEKTSVDLVLCPESIFDIILNEIGDELPNLSLGKTKDELRPILQNILTNSLSHRVTKVAKYSPERKFEFETWNKYWPINFHPTEVERLREKPFAEPELERINHFHHLLLEDMQKNEKSYSLSNFGCIFINPSNNQVICSSSQILSEMNSEQRELVVHKNPLLSPVMLCIDEVAFIAKEEKPGKGKLLYIERLVHFFLSFAFVFRFHSHSASFDSYSIASD
jgi:hypothetical protein